MLSVLGLFSGIGGFELGFRRAGFDIAGVCEIEPYCQAVLRKHFPEARLYADVKEVTLERITRDGIRADIVTGGFPCQDISLAGKGAGLSGERSGLWFEMHRVIAETRPRWVVAENVATLRSRGLDQVLGSLAAIGYDAEWHTVGADDCGASQHRQRLWILAYPDNKRFQGPVWQGQQDAARAQWPPAHSEPLRSTCGYWPPGPRTVDNVPRMVDGSANRVDRLRALGNAVVPQIPESIADAIAMAELTA